MTVFQEGVSVVRDDDDGQREEVKKSLWMVDIFDYSCVNAILRFMLFAIMSSSTGGTRSVLTEYCFQFCSFQVSWS